MQTYLLLMRANEPGALALLSASAEDAEKPQAAIKKLGGKLIGQYVLNGRYDLALVVELPTDEACLAFSLLSSGTGYYTEVLRAFPPDRLQVARALAEALLSRTEAQSDDKS